MGIIKEYWTQLIFLLGVFITFITFIRITILGVKCSLRNDILSIYELGKKKKQITTYQLQAIMFSAELYFKLGGNSFVKEIVDKIKTWEVIN